MLLPPANSELRALPVVAQDHDPGTLKLLIEEQMIGKSLQVHVSPTSGVEVKMLRMFVDPSTSILELLPEVVSQGIVDGIVVAIARTTTRRTWG